MPMQKIALLSVVLCLLGIAVSVELTRIHRLVYTDPNYHSVCAVSEEVNCETVAVSPYSVFAGIPVSVWGILGYLLMGVLSLWALTERRLHSFWPCGLLVMITASSVGVSAILSYISATRIDSICLFCTGSYVINLLLFGLAILAVKKSRAKLRTLFVLDVMALSLRPKLTWSLAIAGGLTIGLAEYLIPAYWRTPGWSDLPALPSGVDEDGRHWIGAENPKLTVVEFSDYECPHCRAAHKAIRTTAAEHPNEIRLVHRHLPLDRACHPKLRRPFHERACLFAEAAECAALQGKFWEMNDAIFSIQETMKTKDVDHLNIAVRLGLDRSAFKECLDTHAAASRVAADLKDAMKHKLTGTPSFLIDGKIFVGRIPDFEISNRLSK